MPKLVWFLIRHAAIGFGLAAAFVAFLLANDVASLATLVARDPQSGALAVFLLTFFTGLTFGSAQMGFAIMLNSQDDGNRPKPERGVVRFASAWQPKTVRATVRAPRGR